MSAITGSAMGLTGVMTDWEQGMIDRIDRIQLAVQDAGLATSTFTSILGAEHRRDDRVKALAARRTVLAVGESEFELLEADGTGPIADHLATKGEGLFGAGLSTADPMALKARLAGQNVPVTAEGEQFFIAPEHTFGVPMVISLTTARKRVGPVNYLYEVTNTILDNWGHAATWYSGLFGIDPQKFHPITSEKFGYTGMLTLFNPPDRLDRIEISQVTNPDSAMGRWTGRHGNSLYMCYVEVHDLPDIIDRLNRHGCRWIPRGGDAATEEHGLFTHPKDFHGLLLGMSRSTLAWKWSGQPDMVFGDFGSYA